MNSFKFGRFEREIDVTDVAFVETYEKAINKYTEAVENMPKLEKASDTMRHMCGLFFEVFDTLFGEGTRQEIFGEQQSVDVCVEALRGLGCVMQDYSSTMDKINAAQPNRAQRRAQKK